MFMKFYLGLEPTPSIFSPDLDLCVFLYVVELDAVKQETRIFEEFYPTKDFQDAFDGSTHYWVTINQYKLEFGRLGETESLIECRNNKNIDDVTIWSQSDMTVAFYGTCPDAGLFDISSLMYF